MDWLIYIFLPLLVLLSFFFSDNVAAYSSLNIGRLRLEAENGGKKQNRAYDLSKNMQNTIFTLLFGSGLSNIAISSIAVLSAMKYLKAHPTDVPVKLITIAITIFIILVFCVITPRMIANDNPNRNAVNGSWLLKIFTVIFLPAVYPVTKMTEKLSTLWKPKRYEQDEPEEELKTMVETIEGEGGFNRKESELIKSAIEFSDDKAFEILTPRVDVFAIDVNDDVDEIIKQVLEEEYSRVPVYEDTIDNIVGILSTKTLMKAAVKKGNALNIRSMMKEPLFIYKAMSISDVMEELKAKRAHMAVVLDEFGGTMGIVTLEDVLEQLVGDIWDETDDREDDSVETGKGVYEVTGDMLLDDFFDIIGYEDKNYDSEYITVGGFATEKLGHLPKAGDSFIFDDHIITLLEVSNMRVEKLKVEEIIK